MKALVNIMDKIIFAALFIAALQVPVLADHYRQYLTGFYDATAQQVAGYESLARQFGYASVPAMLDDLRTNNSPVVRQDAEQKALTMRRLQDLETALTQLQTGNYFSRAWYMFNPDRFDVLKRVGENFAPSVPLSPPAVIYSVVVAIIANMLLWTPAWCVRGVRRLRRRPQHAA